MKEKALKIYKGILILPFRLFYLWPQFLFRTVLRIADIIKFSNNSNNKTLYSSEVRLKRVEIIFYLLKWYMKNGEVNYRFFDYGLDRKENGNRDNYLGHRKFKHLRDRRNSYPFENKETNFNYLCLIRDKFVFSRYLSAFSIPVAKDLAIFNKNTLQWLDTNEEYKTKEFFTNTDMNLSGFCKPVGGIKGKDVFKLELINSKLIMNGNESSFDQLENKISGNYIFQEQIIQHSSLNNIYSLSVNTIRLVTFYNNGEPEIFLGVFRIGSDGRIVDNFSAGGIVVGIDMKTGTLSKYGYHNKFDRPEIVDKHPDTGFKFENFKIPWFNEIKNLVKRSHLWMYGLHSIGWDIVITPSGPVILEANDEWGGILHMITYDNFKEEFMKYYIE